MPENLLPSFRSRSECIAQLTTGRWTKTAVSTPNPSWPASAKPLYPAPYGQGNERNRHRLTVTGFTALINSFHD